MNIDEINKKSLEVHKQSRGKIEISLKAKLDERDDLSILYTPGVAEASRKVHQNPDDVNIYTNRSNTIAIVTDGSAVLGLGDIGPEAGLPVMEGKAVLFKKFGNVDAYPILLKTQDVDEIVETIVNISPTFAGINLEDISAPRCFEIERRLKGKLDIPIFHDDQHGTAIVVLAGLINSLKIVNKNISEIKIVINGAGAAGIAIYNLLHAYGAKNICLLDSKGAICDARSDLTEEKRAVLKTSRCPCGTLEEIIKDADVFIGVSKENVLSREMIKSMTSDPIVFAMANPTPEISYTDAKEAGAKVAATGRSDAPNQINNALVFPGLFRGALDSKAKAITEEMKLAAAEALADCVNDLNEENIIPEVMDPKAHEAVAKAVRNFSQQNIESSI